MQLREREPRMKHRLIGAWKVLRGEYVAIAPMPSARGWMSNATSANADVTIHWTVPPAPLEIWSAAKAGRRAVMRHIEALRRLAD